jgi:hypothetical protein
MPVVPIWSAANGVGELVETLVIAIPEEEAVVSAMAAGADFVVSVLLVAISVTAVAVLTTAGAV